MDRDFLKAGMVVVSRIDLGSVFHMCERCFVEGGRASGVLGMWRYFCRAYRVLYVWIVLTNVYVLLLWGRFGRESGGCK